MWVIKMWVIYPKKFFDCNRSLAPKIWNYITSFTSFSKQIDVQENDVGKMPEKTVIKTTGKRRTAG
jgi:hypothetical protein